MPSRVIVIGSAAVLLSLTGSLSGCGDTEHVPNPFAVPPEEQATETIFVAGAGPPSSAGERLLGLVTAITHGGRADLDLAGRVDTALLGNRAVATGGHAYFSNPDDGTVTAVSAATDEVEGVVRVGIQPGTLALDPSLQFVFVVNHGVAGDARPDSVSVIDVLPTMTTFLQEIARVPVEDGASEIAFSTRRNRAFVSNGLAGTVSVIDVDQANLTSFLSTTASIAVGPAPGVMTYSAVSGRLYVILGFPSAPDSIAIVDADRAGTPNRVSGVPRGDGPGRLPQPTFAQASRKGDVVWVTFGGGIGVIDTATDTVVFRLDLSGFTPNRLVEADDSVLFVSGGEGTDVILVIDASVPTALREVTRIGVGLAGIDRNLALSVDRTRVYVPNSGEGSGSVSVIDIATKAVVATIPTDSANPNAIAAVDLTGLETSAEDDSGDHGHDPGHHSP